MTAHGMDLELVSRTYVSQGPKLAVRVQSGSDKT
jgi:hypothetical protein